MVLYPPTCLCFCVLPASALPPTCSCFVFYTQNLSAYCKHRCWAPPNKQGADQPTPRRTKLRNGTFSEFFSAVRLGLRLPSILRRRWSFSAGLSPAPRRAAAQGGAQGEERPRPSEFCAVYGRERASGPTRRAKWAKKWFALRSWAQRDLVKTSR
jgi:hypothetical protein